MSDSAWQVFTVEELVKFVDGGGAQLHEFIRTPSLHCMVYRLPAGARDMQAPHLEDEIYMVLSGRAKLRVGGQERRVSAGNILFVRATLEHSFFNIEEDLTLIAVFGALKA